MKDNKIINDNDLKLVSGGVLLDGWDSTLLFIMEVYKKTYGDKGKEKVIELMKISLNDPTSPLEENDMETIYKFIEENWK